MPYRSVPKKTRADRTRSFCSSDRPFVAYIRRGSWTFVATTYTVFEKASHEDRASASRMTSCCNIQNAVAGSTLWHHRERTAWAIEILKSRKLALPSSTKSSQGDAQRSAVAPKVDGYVSAFSALDISTSLLITL